MQQVHQNIRGSDGFTYPNPVLVPAERDRLYPFCGGRPADDGSTWRRYTVVPADGEDNVRPVVPRFFTGGAMGLLWLRGVYHA